MITKHDDSEDTLPMLGRGPHERPVLITYFADDAETFEVLRVWFPRRPREGSRLTCRGVTWQLCDFSQGEWTACEDLP